MIKAIIFDFFDVIYTDALAEMLRKRGGQHAGEIEEVSHALDLGLITTDQLFEQLAHIFGESADELRNECLTYNVLNEELLSLIEHFSKYYRVGLLSNSRADFLRGLLRDHDLERLFHDVVISSEVGVRKPNPAIFKHILSKLGVEPREAVFIDDKSINVRAASELGITGIVYKDMPSLLVALKGLSVTLPSGN